MAAHRRHDISDKVWANIEKLLPGSKGSVGRPSADNRLFINAVFWILRTGAPWRDLPPDLGDWKNTHRRFCRWRDRGAWEKILEALRACLETSAFIVTRRHVDKKRLCAAAKTREDCQTVPQRSDGQRMGACTSSPAPCFWRRSEAQNRPA